MRPVVDDSEAVLASAGAAMEQVEHEIEDLWRDSMQVDDRALSQRLAELSHAVHRAARMLDHESIG